MTASAAIPGKIDIHTHAGLTATFEKNETRKLREKMIRLARRQGIERMIVLGNVSIGGNDPTVEQILAINDDTLDAMAQSDAFLGFCYLHPAHPVKFIEEEIERCVVKGGMRGIKLWISVKATDARLDPIMDRARALKIPVLHHAWNKATGNGPYESTPAEVADLARRHPRTIVVMAHLTGGGARGVLDVVDAPNVLIDTSGGQPEAGGVEYAVKILGRERVIYGSDWPIRDFATQVARVTGAGLDRETQEFIFRRNALRALKGLSIEEAKKEAL